MNRKDPDTRCCCHGTLVTRGLPTGLTARAVCWPATSSFLTTHDTNWTNEGEHWERMATGYAGHSRHSWLKQGRRARLAKSVAFGWAAVCDQLVPPDTLCDRTTCRRCRHIRVLPRVWHGVALPRGELDAPCGGSSRWPRSGERGEDGMNGIDGIRFASAYPVNLVFLTLRWLVALYSLHLVRGRIRGLAQVLEIREAITRTSTSTSTRRCSAGGSTKHEIPTHEGMTEIEAPRTLR